MARHLIIEASIAIAIGIMLALIGPFGSYDASLAMRLAYWVPLVLVGYAIMRPSLLLGEMVAKRLDLPALPTIAAAMAIGNLPLSFLIFWLNGSWPTWPSAEQLLSFYSSVGTITLIVFTIYMLIGRAEATAQEQEAPVETAAASSRFHGRLPSHFPLPLLALEMEDHYVRAHGNGGSELILMRLRDAVAELDDIEGAQVHRSWWVARDAVTNARRDGRRWILSLEGGLEAPVARERAAELREKGWF